MYLESITLLKRSNEMAEMAELAELAELVTSGLAFYKQNDYESAIRKYTEAITLDTGNAKIYNYRGLAYFYDRQYDKAIADYERALESEPHNEGIKKRLVQARKRKEESEQTITTGPVPRDIAIKRFKQLEEFLKRALRGNEDIALRANVAGDDNILNTYICFGTRKMDEKFPRGQPGTRYLGTGHQYYYWFHFGDADSNTMTGCFEFSLRDQDQKTKAIMNNCYRRYNEGAFPQNEQRRIKYFDLHVNLRRVFSYEEVREEVNKTLGEMLKWEDEYLETLG
jgi:tetratricopeptide (TPR) repeat protein